MDLKPINEVKELLKDNIGNRVILTGLDIKGKVIGVNSGHEKFMGLKTGIVIAPSITNLNWIDRYQLTFPFLVEKNGDYLYIDSITETIVTPFPPENIFSATNTGVNIDNLDTYDLYQKVLLRKGFKFSKPL
ncbi:hypothetical protein GOV08_05375 [Candidatus Woesearchaeota archaeon]|nr:hypothetical protein [Candidatus Woesearchaeota archaeon]